MWNSIISNTINYIDRNLLMKRGLNFYLFFGYFKSPNWKRNLNQNYTHLKIARKLCFHRAIFHNNSFYWFYQGLAHQNMTFKMVIFFKVHAFKQLLKRTPTNTKSLDEERVIFFVREQILYTTTLYSRLPWLCPRPNGILFEGIESRSTWTI